MWGNTKMSNICVIGVPEGKKKRMVQKKSKELIAEMSFFCENQKFIDFKSSEHPKQDKYKELQAKIYYNQTFEN